MEGLLIVLGWFWNVSLFLCYMVKYPERQEMALKSIVYFSLDI